MKNIVERKLLDVSQIKIDGEVILVRHFDEIGLNSLKELTPSRVDVILSNYWAPDGFIAWNLSGETLEMVFFKGRNAIVTKFSEEEITRNLLISAMSLNNLAEKQVISTLDDDSPKYYKCA